MFARFGREPGLQAVNGHPVQKTHHGCRCPLPSGPATRSEAADLEWGSAQLWVFAAHCVQARGDGVGPTFPRESAEETGGRRKRTEPCTRAIVRAETREVQSLYPV